MCLPVAFAATVRDRIRIILVSKRASTKSHSNKNTLELFLEYILCYAKPWNVYTCKHVVELYFSAPRLQYDVKDSKRM
jgi:hypothetical protein